MIDRLATIAKQAADAIGSVAGIRAGTEEPRYDARPLADDVEIRRYGQRIAAQTTIIADEEQARTEGFRRLARYIFGANDGQRGIAMTAPVAVQPSTPIAMTAPVAQYSAGDGSWVVRFYMPSKWTLDTLPSPEDERVDLVTVPPETFAVLRFSGDRGAEALNQKTAYLRKLLHDNAIDASGRAVAWFYDPPWTLPCRRRNEIAILLP